MKGNVPPIKPNPEWPPVVFYPDFADWVKAGNYKFGRHDYEAALKYWAGVVARRGNTDACLKYTKYIKDYHERWGNFAYWTGWASLLTAAPFGPEAAGASGALSWWHDSEAIYACDVCDPLFLDLNGNAIKTVGLQEGTFFDHNGDGFAELSGWVSTGEGQLCIDLNGNGTIDNGSELFSSFMQLPNGQLATDGFQALAALDGNQDGKIDAQDPAYSQLMVWGVFSGEEGWEAGAVFTLPDLGITSIDLDWTTVNTTDTQGNIEVYAGSFQYTDGSTGLIADYGFRIKPYNTIPLETLPVPDDIAALPDVPASGLVYEIPPEFPEPAQEIPKNDVRVIE